MYSYFNPFASGVQAGLYNSEQIMPIRDKVVGYSKVTVQHNRNNNSPSHVSQNIIALSKYLLTRQII